jgi:predicted nucleic acid-binding protein
MVLVDTSVWIATFRARKPLDLEAIVSIDEVGDDPDRSAGSRIYLLAAPSASR